jgi:uncharacterized membrane protein YgcG
VRGPPPAPAASDARLIPRTAPRPPPRARATDAPLPAPARPAGQALARPPLLARLTAFFARLWELVAFFFRTIFDPTAADEFSAKGARRGGVFGAGGGGGKPGGGGGGPGFGGGGGPRGPRVSGMSALRDAGGDCAAGA